MGIWDDLGQFIQQAEAEEKHIQQQQNGLNINTPAQAAAAGGSGFHVSPEELHSLLTQWQDLESTLNDAITQSKGTQTSIAPAEDDASVSAGDAVQASMNAYQTHLQAMHDYAANYVQSLTQALKNYSEAEAGNRGSATNVHTSLKS